MECASFVFPAVKGIQATREYYTSMVPLEVIPKIFQFYDENLPPEIRCQRTLNKSRIPEIRDYILDNPDDYVFSSLTVSVDGEMEFIPITNSVPQLGHIEISMSSIFLINDGQHRQAAIAEAIRLNPKLKNEHISVVFFRDNGLSRSQQMFSDLNRYAIRPTKSINILYNSRDESSIIAKEIIQQVPVFCDMIDKEHTSLSNRSKALFTLSAISTATDALLRDNKLNIKEKTMLASSFWSAVSKHIPEWNAVKNGQVKASQIRTESICTLSITLTAIGRGGNSLLQTHPDDWESLLFPLDSIDWSKSNPIWKPLIFVNGKVSTNRASLNALSNHIQNILMEKVGVNNA